MKSQILILVLFIIGTIFFQPTYQYRLARRELTEYDLTSFIVNTCSFDQNDALIQGLCDQTLQSAVMGNFPFLTYYCKTIGAGMKYCKNINQYTNNHHERGAKRYANRRYIRSVDEINKFYPKNFDMNTENDSNEKQIMQICIIKSGESSVHRDEFCNQILEEIQQGLHPETKRFCKYHLRSDFCRQVWSHSPSFSRLSSIPSSHSLPTHSKLPTKNQPSSDSSSAFKVSASKSIIDQ